MRSNKKTVLQQLVDRLKRDIDYFNSLLKEQGYVEMRISTMAKISQTEHILKYAEKMLEEEKEQIIDAFGIGCQVESTRLIGYQDIAEQYYKETYEQ